MKTKKEDYGDLEPIIKRFDIILRLMLMKEFTDESNKFKLRESVKFLSRCGLEPNDIAKLVGKKKATEISYILYSKTK